LCTSSNPTSSQTSTARQGKDRPTIAYAYTNRQGCLKGARDLVQARVTFKKACDAGDAAGCKLLRKLH
jgi:hypothetical protein